MFRLFVGFLKIYNEKQLFPHMLTESEIILAAKKIKLAATAEPQRLTFCKVIKNSKEHPILGSTRQPSLLQLLALSFQLNSFSSRIFSLTHSAPSNKNCANLTTWVVKLRSSSCGWTVLGWTLCHARCLCLHHQFCCMPTAIEQTASLNSAQHSQHFFRCFHPGGTNDCLKSYSCSKSTSRPGRPEVKWDSFIPD